MRLPTVVCFDPDGDLTKEQVLDLLQNQENEVIGVSLFAITVVIGGTYDSWHTKLSILF